MNDAAQASLACPKAEDGGHPYGQVVLVLQGGGALGAYQAGVYAALHEAGLEPDWVIGTSIGAVNGVIIAANPIEVRLERLIEFWRGIGFGQFVDEQRLWSGLAELAAKISAVTLGVPGFFQPNPQAAWGSNVSLGVDRAAFYTAEPLKGTLRELADFDVLRDRPTRLTVGAVNVRTGDMTYFDSRDMVLGPEHILASGALPPAFPAVRVGSDAYWDGGICSNTPIEVVLDDNPRRDSLIFSVNVWQKEGAEPTSIAQVMSRHKDIQYASRIEGQVARQGQLHRLRHIIRDLAEQLPRDKQSDPRIRDLVAYGCSTTMHLVELVVPGRGGDDHTKDIDFSRASIRTRWHAGHADAQVMLQHRVWMRDHDPLDGLIVHRQIGAAACDLAAQ